MFHRAFVLLTHADARARLAPVLQGLEPIRRQDALDELAHRFQTLPSAHLGQAERVKVEGQGANLSSMVHLFYKDWLLSPVANSWATGAPAWGASWLPNMEPQHGTDHKGGVFSLKCPWCAKPIQIYRIRSYNSSKTLRLTNANRHWVRKHLDQFCQRLKDLAAAKQDRVQPPHVVEVAAADAFRAEQGIAEN